MERQDRLEKIADAVVPEAIEWVKELRAYRIYQGKDADYFRKARIGLGVVGAAVRICATIENSRSNNLIEGRLRLLEDERKGLDEPNPRELPPAQEKH